MSFSVSLSQSNWPTIALGLAVGVGVAFKVINASDKSRSSVDTVKNYFHLISGAAEVSLSFVWSWTSFINRLS
jgi:hypothetical protein